MRQKQYILQSLIIEVTAVLLASMIAFQVCNMFGIRMSLTTICYGSLDMSSSNCYIISVLSSARHIVDAIPPSTLPSVKKSARRKDFALGFFSCLEL